MLFSPAEFLASIDPFWGYVTAFGVAAVGAIALAYFFPQIRGAMIALIAVGVAILTIYRKGQQDQKELEEQKKKGTIKRIEDKYKKIEDRKTSNKDVEDRLKKGTF